MIITDIAGGAQMPFPSGSDLNLEGNYPIDGMLSPLAVQFTRTGLQTNESIKIGEIGGSLILQSTLRGAQNVNIPESLGKLFIPSQQPWQVEYKKIELEFESPEEEFYYE